MKKAKLVNIQEKVWGKKHGWVHQPAWGLGVQGPETATRSIQLRELRRVVCKQKRLLRFGLGAEMYSTKKKKGVCGDRWNFLEQERGKGGRIRKTNGKRKGFVELEGLFFWWRRSGGTLTLVEGGTEKLRH